MGTVLKALGMTIWGLIALGLLTVFLFVGYQAALKHRGASPPLMESLPSDRVFAKTEGTRSVASPAAQPAAPTPATPSLHQPLESSDLAHQLLQHAAESHQSGLAIQYGQELFENGTASADDLLLVAQTYFSVSDCDNARIWADRANAALGAAGRESPGSVDAIIKGCEPRPDRPRVAREPAQKDRALRLFKSFDARAQTDRKSLPQFEAEAAKAPFGGPSVLLGELYFGFDDYEHAIASIQRGLDKGHVPHLDDAYVYLGLSEQALGNLDDARRAFARLKDVPGISPRVLLLWSLYAETQL